MTTGNQIAPDAVLAELLGATPTPRPQKIKSLMAIHEVCQAVFEIGPRDFSLNNIGKLCEKRGILKARGLNNAPAADHRRLIDAWSKFAGPPPAKIRNEGLISEAYVNRIEDPAIRMLVKRDLAELRRIRAQLNTLKSTKLVQIDRRPVHNAQPLVRDSSKVLTDSERSSLRKAISVEFLASRGWQEIELGEIVNDRGKTLFEPGYATGLRKLLEE